MEIATTAIVPNIGYKPYRSHPAIANSDLGNFDKGPKAYSGIKTGQMQGDISSGFKMGNVLDSFVLTRAEFDSTYLKEPYDIVKPTSPQEQKFCAQVLDGEKASDSITEIYAVGKKTEEAIAKMAFEKIEKFEVYLDYQRRIRSGKEPYSLKDHDDLMTMNDAIVAHNEAFALLFTQPRENDTFEAHSQVAIFWEMLDIECKGLLDRLIIDHSNKIVYYYDLKYSGKGVHGFEYSVRKYRYYRQLAYYRAGLRILFPGYSVHARIIAATPLYGGECRVLELPELYFVDGEAEYTRLINDLKYAMETGHWEYRRSYYENNGVEVIPYV